MGGIAFHDADTEAELRDCFIKLKGMLEKAAKPNVVDELLIKRGKKKTKKSTGGTGAVMRFKCGMYTVCLSVVTFHMTIDGCSLCYS